MSLTLDEAVMAHFKSLRVGPEFDMFALLDGIADDAADAPFPADPEEGRKVLCATLECICPIWGVKAHVKAVNRCLTKSFTVRTTAHVAGTIDYFDDCVKTLRTAPKATPIMRMSHTMGILAAMVQDEEWIKKGITSPEDAPLLPGILSGIHRQMAGLLAAHTDEELGVAGESRSSLECALRTKEAQWRAVGAWPSAPSAKKRKQAK